MQSFEVAPLHLGRCLAFILPGTGRACSRSAQLRSPFLDGAAPTDRRIPDRPGLCARTGRKSWPRPIDRGDTEVLLRRAGQPFLFEAGTHDRCRRVPRSMAMLKPLASGPGLCRVPDTSGVDDTLFLLFFDAGQAGRDRGWVRHSLPRNPHARAVATPPTHAPTPHLPAVLHRPSSAYCIPHNHLTPICPRVRRSSISPFCLGQGRVRRAEAARRRWHGPCGPGARLCALGGSVGGALGVRRRASRAASPAQKKDDHGGRIFVLPPVEKS